MQTPLSQLFKHQPCMLDSKQAFRDMFYKARGRPNKSGFEETFTELLDAFPKAKKYLMQLYDDRERWAVAFSPLSFCVASWTTNRVEGTHTVYFMRAFYWTI